MGRWTVKHIVTKHGRSIRVELKLDQGTRFTVWWPRTHVPAEEFVPSNLSAVS